MLNSPQDLPLTTETFVADGVGLSIDGSAILSDVSLEFPAGEVVALVGHNGSGKSSLIKMLARQLLPSAGSISYGGLDLRHYHERAFARSVAYLPQE
jgi:iron-chelate-transporting ATPase